MQVLSARTEQTNYPCFGGHSMTVSNMAFVFLRAFFRERLELAAENLACREIWTKFKAIIRPLSGPLPL